MTEVMAPPAESPVTKMRALLILWSRIIRPIICLIEEASPRPRLLSCGLNQLKHPLALFDSCCSGISNAKPQCFASVDQPAPKS